MENLLLWGLYVASFYAFLPGLISRTFGFRVFKKGRVEKEISLTFDDGPDEIYTPELLDLLARYNAKATFFVVGSHAEGQEKLLRRMKEHVEKSIAPKEETIVEVELTVTQKKYYKAIYEKVIPRI